MIHSVMTYHIIAFAVGFLLDLLLGDPYWLPHPIRLIGNMISAMDKRLRNSVQKDTRSQENNDQRLFRRGIQMVIQMLLGTFLAVGIVLTISYVIHPFLGILVESVMTYQILATKCLKVESMKVYRELKRGDLEAARKAVSMIVGRDTNQLTKEGVAKAAIETVAENTSDGVIAPMLYTALGGPILGFCYKTVNTMDSMVGYKNEKYLFFGRAAAKLDDVCNYLPARISAWLMILDCLFLGKEFNYKNARRIFKRDRYHHASPNSAQTEAVCAGALSIQLAGDASYFGKVVKKPTIGDAIRPVEYEDIRRANRMLYAASFSCEIICIGIMGAVLFICGGMI